MKRRLLDLLYEYKLSYEHELFLYNEKRTQPVSDDNSGHEYLGELKGKVMILQDALKRIDKLIDCTIKEN